MKILDKYLTQKFLGTLIFSLISFAVIFIIMDVIGFLDKFIDHKVPITIVIQYYLYYLPYIIVLTLPVATLLASLFSVGQLARYNEIIAMQTSGLSNNRILAPLFMIGLILSLVTMYAGERFVPYTNQMKKDVYDSYVNPTKKKSKRKTKNIQLQIENDRWFNVGFFDVNTNTAFNVSVEDIRDNTVVERIDAPKMRWTNDKWVLDKPTLRVFSEGREKMHSMDSLDVALISFKPEDIARVQKKAEEMNFWELKNLIAEVRRTGGKPDRLLVELYLKIAFPFANLIIILFGAPLASQKTRSGTAVSFGISLFICFLYFGIIKVGQSLGQNGAMPPLLAAWLGNLIFGSGAVYILSRSN